EGLHRSWDAEARAAAWPKYRPESAEGHTPALSAVVFFLGLDFGVEGRTVLRFVEWSVLGGVVGRQAGDTAVGKNLVSCAVRHGGRVLVVEVLFAVGLAVGLGFCFSLMDVEAGVFFEAADVSLGEWHGDLLLDSFRKFGGHLLELFDAGKLVDVFEAEAYEEVLGRLVQDRAPDDLLAAGVDAANLGDLGRGNGLLIRDNGEGFERLEREFQGRLETLDEAADGVVVLRLGGKAEAAGNLTNLEAAVVGGIVGDELIEDGAEVVAEATGVLRLLARGGSGVGLGVGYGCRFGGFSRGFRRGFRLRGYSGRRCGLIDGSSRFNGFAGGLRVESLGVRVVLASASSSGSDSCRAARESSSACA